MRKTNFISILQGLEDLGIHEARGVLWNLEPSELIEEAVKNGEGILADSGALVCHTGKITHRSPKDRYIVHDQYTKDKIWWGDHNISLSEEVFDSIFKRMTTYLSGKQLYIRDAAAGADPDHRLNIRIIDTQAWHNLFCHNMFLRLSEKELESFDPDFTILVVPAFQAHPERDNIRSENFTIINFTKRLILVGGTSYSGETKKGVFSVLNFLLPEKEAILPMHCGANMGKSGDTAIFFGLTGSGKTSLSADSERYLIGDDEHGWTNRGIFNFEGGCYAKVANINEENEPEIFRSIKYGAILENTKFFPGTRNVNFTNTEITKNTRVSYPLYHIPHAVEPSIGGMPSHIFVLANDGFGVLPPIARLTIEQAIFYYLLGYNCDVEVSEKGHYQVIPKFSACFGSAFLPLHPVRYAEILYRNIRKYNVNVWLLNTGWSGGKAGNGTRIKLKYTKQLIAGALNNDFSQIEFQEEPIFNLQLPTHASGIPPGILNPSETWQDIKLYRTEATKLMNLFQQVHQNLVTVEKKL